MSSGLSDDPTPSDLAKTQRGRSLRIAGSSLFLAFALLVVAALIHTVFVARSRRLPMKALWLLTLAAPFMVVRGIFGVLQGADGQFSYYNLDNYTGDGLSTHLLLGEYVMGSTMEASWPLLTR